MKKSRSVVNLIREKHSQKDNETHDMNPYEPKIQYSSERKTESEIKRLENHYKFLLHLFQSIPCAIAHFSCSGTPKMKYCNKAVIDFCGFEDRNGYEQLLGVGFNRFVPTEWVQYVNNLFTQILEKEEPIEFEYQMYKVDGSLIWVRGILQKSVSENGEPILQSVYMNITNQKINIDNRNSDIAQLQELMNNMPAGVAIYEVTDGIHGIYINDELCKLAGYDIEEYKRITAKDAFFCVHPDDSDKIVTELQRCMVGNKQFDMNFRFIQKSQEFKWVNLKAKIVEQNDDKIVWYAVYTDIKNLYDRKQEVVNQRQDKVSEETFNAIDEGLKNVNSSVQDLTSIIKELL